MSYATVRTISQRISIQHLWALVVLVGVFIFVNTHPIRPHDFWWHMAVGREILLNGQIPQVDIYSYTAYGAPYPSYQVFWLMEIVLYLIYQAGRAPLVVFIQSMVITTAYSLILVTCLQQSHAWRAAAFGIAFAALLGLNSWNVRPQVITFLLGALFLYLIPRLQRGLKRGWAFLFPLLMVVWVNSHGTFPLGIFFLSLWLGQEVWELLRVKWVGGNGESARRLLFPGIILLLSLLACLINPRGLGVLQYLQTLFGNSVVQNLVVEWAPPTFDTLGGGLFLAVLLLTAVILALSPRRPTFYQLFGFIGMAAMALITSRGIIWFGLVMAPVVAEHSRAIWGHLKGDKKSQETSHGSPVINWLFLGILLALAIITLPWFKEQLPMPEAKAGLISGETPIHATDFILETLPPGNIFHAMSFGSYLIWAAQPGYRVFVDGRIELYSQEIWGDYIEISNAVGDWEARLDGYGVHTLMLSRSEQPHLVSAVLSSGRWELVFEDGAALIFINR
jgi:hypothetical protein